MGLVCGLGSGLGSGLESGLGPGAVAYLSATGGGSGNAGHPFGLWRKRAGTNRPFNLAERLLRMHATPKKFMLGFLPSDNLVKPWDCSVMGD